MQEPLASISPDIEDLIQRTVREYMAPFALRKIAARPGRDHDGDPVIFVEADYDLSETPIDPLVTGELTYRLWMLLGQHGETRFPHIHHNFDEAQTVASRGRRRRKA